jgi:hypothetical protein
MRRAGVPPASTAAAARVAASTGIDDLRMSPPFTPAIDGRVNIA